MRVRACPETQARCRYLQRHPSFSRDAGRLATLSCKDLSVSVTRVFFTSKSQQSSIIADGSWPLQRRQRWKRFHAARTGSRPHLKRGHALRGGAYAPTCAPLGRAELPLERQNPSRVGRLPAHPPLTRVVPASEAGPCPWPRYRSPHACSTAALVPATWRLSDVASRCAPTSRGRLACDPLRGGRPEYTSAESARVNVDIWQTVRPGQRPVHAHIEPTPRNSGE